ncbi:MAG: Lrp/AsnC ligand binding domain-containing protein [Candidatus Brockarchaeota archaeon]|nr:Lrp/AsnC ligand binding domain-containing protein [Candidatus Brockarchaeota archaeon]MBO3809418.1 Lrp/AsnC ligand binding domain-containing protein [Candidatus Brockarchaeota archaeon]
MVRGLMLVKAGYAAALEIAREASKVQGVLDAYPVFGRFDVAVFIQGKDLQELRNVALKIVALKGVRSTETLLEAV